MPFFATIRPAEHAAAVCRGRRSSCPDRHVSRARGYDTRLRDRGPDPDALEPGDARAMSLPLVELVGASHLAWPSTTSDTVETPDPRSTPRPTKSMPWSPVPRVIQPRRCSGPGSPFHKSGSRTYFGVPLRIDGRLVVDPAEAVIDSEATQRRGPKAPMSRADPTGPPAHQRSRQGPSPLVGRLFACARSRREEMVTMTGKKLLALLALLAALLFIMAACGDDDDEASSTGSSTITAPRRRARGQHAPARLRRNSLHLCGPRGGDRWRRGRGAHQHR